MIIFKEVVHEDDEFSHAGGERHHGSFSGSAQALVKLLEDAVMAHGAQGRHIQGTANGTTPATNGTLPFLSTTVTIVGSYSCQSRRRLLVERSQLGHFSQNCKGDDLPDSRDCLQTVGLMGQLGVLGDECSNGLVALVDLFLQKLDQLPALAAGESVCVMFGVVMFHNQQANQLTATLRTVRQLLLLGRSLRERSGLEGLAILGQDRRINGVSFGPQTLGARKVTYPARFQDTDRNACGLEGTHPQLFITAGGFTNDLGMGISAQVFEQLDVAFTVIGQGVKTACEVQLQRKLGNIEADIEDGSVVLTHTCRMRATIFELSCSNNGSSLGQWARVKHATGRITPKRMPGAKVPTRTVIGSVATGPMTPAWLSFSKLPSKDKVKIQGVPSFSPAVAESARLPWVNRPKSNHNPERVVSIRNNFLRFVHIFYR